MLFQLAVELGGDVSRLDSMLARLDRHGDGNINRSELAASLARMAQLSPHEVADAVQVRSNVPSNMPSNVPFNFVCSCSAAPVRLRSMPH